MAEERTQRRLAAIVAADVVGYSRLIRIDEDGTLAALKARRKVAFPIRQMCDRAKVSDFSRHTITPLPLYAAPAPDYLRKAGGMLRFLISRANSARIFSWRSSSRIKAGSID